ncbi:MAG: pirin-like C-terminal cupin domain-containing protein, partial [Mobilitalea sp.]
YFGGEEKKLLPLKRAVLFGKGDEIVVTTGESSTRILIFMGKPLREPVAWGGPIVMNTSEEVDQAFKEIREGKFGK